MSDNLFAPPSKPRSSRLTLILVLALVASGAANYWLWQERQRAIADGKSAIAKLAAAEATARDVTQKIQEMQGESIALAEKKPPPPARDARDAGIAASEAAKKAEQDAATAKELAAKPEPEAKAKAKATDSGDEDKDEGQGQARGKGQSQARAPGDGGGQGVVPAREEGREARQGRQAHQVDEAREAGAFGQGGEARPARAQESGGEARGALPRSRALGAKLAAAATVTGIAPVRNSTLTVAARH